MVKRFRDRVWFRVNFAQNVTILQKWIIRVTSGRVRVVSGSGFSRVAVVPSSCCATSLFLALLLSLKNIEIQEACARIANLLEELRKEAVERGWNLDVNLW